VEDHSNCAHDDGKCEHDHGHGHVHGAPTNDRTVRCLIEYGYNRWRLMPQLVKHGPPFNILFFIGLSQCR
jgi:hypothetical protein